jgi:saccharopine dehydrogenase (NAD+, L-lysine-forming)
MSVTVGIRREDKNQWERRVPLIPRDLAALTAAHDFEFLVQASPIRVFGDDEYRAAGVTVTEDLADADVVAAVKEIPAELLRERTVYLFFSHTIKGQEYNMPLLQRLLDLEATLIDYERIADEKNRRLIFFSLHAGYAGMIETLRAFGQRLAAQGVRTPLAEVQPAYAYDDLPAALADMRRIGDLIRREGMGDHRQPVIIGVAGYGNVAKGCDAVLDCLPVRRIKPAELAAAAAGGTEDFGPLVQVTFREEDMVEPKSADAQFVLQDYYQRPGNYRGVFARYLPQLDILVNSTYWDDRYPRLVTKKWAKTAWNEGKSDHVAPRLQVIGDISCDIEGGIELTLEATMPDAPCFVYEAATGRLVPGVTGAGPAVMAVDNLPCELPRESSEHFSQVLSGLLPAFEMADFNVDFEGLALPPHLKKAVVAHRGELTPAYRYLQEHLDRAGR